MGTVGVSVIMSCYFPDSVPQRRGYAKQALHGLLNNLYSVDELRLIVADDTPEGDDLASSTALNLILDANGVWGSCGIQSRSYHHGIGASLNKALEGVADDGLWMYITDDWVLGATLSLQGPVRLLVDRGYDVVRLGPIHPDLMCVTRFDQGIGWWLDIRQEYGGFAFATRPFVATKAFVAKVGPFDEGLNSYETERLYSERIGARGDVKLAYWGAVDLAGPWTHVGLVDVGYRDLPEAGA